MTDLEKLERANHSMSFLVHDLEALCGADNPYLAENILQILGEVHKTFVLLDTFLNIELSNKLNRGK